MYLRKEVDRIIDYVINKPNPIVQVQKNFKKDRLFIVSLRLIRNFLLLRSKNLFTKRKNPYRVRLFRVFLDVFRLAFILFRLLHRSRIYN